ncbi:hypothetical protein ACNA3T_26430, partial [Klebsiella pneumoniae]
AEPVNSSKEYINTLLRTLTADLIVIAILTFPYNKRNKNIAKVIMIITTINHMIYHNVALRAPLRRSEGISGGYGIKPATNHPENRRKRA